MQKYGDGVFVLALLPLEVWALVVAFLFALLQGIVSDGRWLWHFAWCCSGQNGLVVAFVPRCCLATLRKCDGVKVLVVAFGSVSLSDRYRQWHFVLGAGVDERKDEYWWWRLLCGVAATGKGYNRMVMGRRDFWWCAGEPVHQNKFSAYLVRPRSSWSDKK